MCYKYLFYVRIALQTVERVPDPLIYYLYSIHFVPFSYLPLNRLRLANSFFLLSVYVQLLFKFHTRTYLFAMRTDVASNQ